MAGELGEGVCGSAEGSVWQLFGLPDAFKSLLGSRQTSIIPTTGVYALPPVEITDSDRRRVFSVAVSSTGALGQAFLLVDGGRPIGLRL